MVAPTDLPTDRIVLSRVIARARLGLSERKTVEKQGKQRRQAFTPKVKKTLVKVLVGIVVAVATREICAAMPGRDAPREGRDTGQLVCSSDERR
jgi:hypothetical protein